MTMSHGCHLPRHWCEFSLFAHLQISWVSNDRPSFRMAPDWSTLRYSEQTQLISFPMLVSHTGGVTARPNHCTELKACKKCGFLLWLRLQFVITRLSGLLCSYGLSLSMEISGRIVNCFLLFSALSLCLSMFSNCLVTSFLTPDALPLFVLEI
jgi:hypothetical protein